MAEIRFLSPIINDGRESTYPTGTLNKRWACRRDNISSQISIAIVT